MKDLLSKLGRRVFHEVGRIGARVKKDWNSYINEVIELQNRLHKRRLLSNQLCKESRIVSQDSLEVLAEFENLNNKD